MQIDNAIVFVTGANRGLGRHLVERLLAEGAAKIYAGVRDIASVDASWVSDNRVRLVQVDVNDADSVQDAAAAATDTTVLINNAGTLRFGTALEGDVSEYQADLDTNLFGSMRMSQAFAPHLTQNAPAAIVNISSIIALAPAPGMVGYSISKAAVHSYSQALRAELRGSGVEVSAVYPAQIDTDMLKGVEVDKAAPAHVAERIISGLREGARDIYPEDSSTYLSGVYASDPWRLEQLFSGAAE